MSTDTSKRAELEAIAMSYVEGLLSAQGANIPFSPDVVRAHLIVTPGKPMAWQMTKGADEIRSNVQREKLTARKNLRTIVDVENSNVVILWESGMEIPYARHITIMDRFVIKDNLITEIEIISIPQGEEFQRTDFPGWDAMVKDASGE